LRALGQGDRVTAFRKHPREQLAINIVVVDDQQSRWL
jgi:hypothetical protein